MKKYILNHCMEYISKNQTEYDSTKLAEIRYGLESIYILITKTIFIFLVAALLNILKEVVIFTILYNLIRMPSFGLHATKSWICLALSTLIFIIVPFICKVYYLPIMVRSLIGVIAILFIFKNAPADTYKRPIVNKERRERYKLISTFVAILMTFISLFLQDGFLANSLVLSLIVQCFMISPFVYKLFHLPYNNYKRYLVEETSTVV